MKTVCPICGNRKAKRVCKKRERAEICSLCCADARDTDCDGCDHHIAAQRYRADRHSLSMPSERPFIAEINPEVERAVNDAVGLAQRGHADQARAMMEGLLHDHPASHTVHFGMGVLHVLQDEHQESIPWFDKATTLFPYCVEAHFNKALAYQEELDVINAVRAYRKLIEVGDPKEPEVKQAKTFLEDVAATIRKSDGVSLDTYMESQDAFNRAFALMEQGDWARALAGFRAAAEMNDRNAPTHGNMGMCLAKLGRKAEALAELDRALEINPEYEPARFNRVGVVRMVEGRPLDTAGFRRIEFSKEQVMRERGRGSFFRRLSAIFERKDKNGEASDDRT